MKILGTLPILAGVLAALGAGWAGFPRAIYKSTPQPVNFSHKVHVETGGAKCEDCHAFRADGTFVGIPSLESCAACHAAAIGTTADEKRFVEEYVARGREPQWRVYARQPENVWFSHATHVKLAQLKCERCHADHGSTASLRAYQEDRISGYSRDIWGERPLLQKASARPPMTMDGCVDCHRQQGLSHSCLDCHK